MKDNDIGTWEELLEFGAVRLLEASIEEARLDAWYLFSFITGFSRTDFLLHKTEFFEEKKAVRYRKCIEKRASHYPLQYIIGMQEFMGLTFTVNENVLIPRQDTEILVEEVLKVCTGKSVLDLCTGSGCIIISLVKLSNISRGTGVDISEEALKIAEENSKVNETRIQFMKSNLFENVKNKYDIIVSNPPYIKRKVIDTLMPEVRSYEPLIALDGKEDGLYFYRQIISQAVNFLNPGGRIFFEIGYDQGSDVKHMLIEAGFQEVVVIKDLAGMDRVVKGSLKE